MVAVNRVLCVVQARTDSSRLPAKALLPVGGIPLAVLAAKRVANDGLETILATSDRTDDDHLAHVAESFGLRVFRGDAHDVRQRFLDAAAALSPEDIVVRLTADNVIPDGPLVRALVEEFVSSGALIASLGTPQRSLPYGVSVEATTAKNLRESAEWRSDGYSREHVTPALWERQGEYSSRIRHPLGALDHLRSTVDNLDDFQRIVRVFDGVADPVGVAWSELVTRLAHLDDAPQRLSTRPSLTLGTVQLGMTYGSVTPVDPPSDDIASAMVRRAIDHGLHLDTARAYGRSEEILGTVLRGRGPSATEVVTKLDPLTELKGGESAQEVAARTEASVFKSLALLGRDARPAVLLHRASHRTDWNGGAWNALQRLRDEGWISRIGVSVANPTEMADALEDPVTEIVQCSRNLLDHRWHTARVRDALQERTDVEIQARSAFLQGILLAPVSGWPSVSDVNPSEITQTLDRLVAALGRTTRLDLCLAWLRAERPVDQRVDRIVVGAQNLQQFDEILTSWSRAPLTPDQLAACAEALPHVPNQLLDPAQWPRA